jgi:hypothetical protein
MSPLMKEIVGIRISCRCTQYLMLLLAALLFSSKVLSESLVEETVLQNWGFRNLEQQHYDMQLCGYPLEAKITTQSIKALLPEKDSDVYPRFTLIREQYATTDLAISRIEQLNNQQFKNSLESKSCSLRKAKQNGEFVFLVHTDALRFANQLESLVLQLMEDSNTMTHSPDTK